MFTETTQTSMKKKPAASTLPEELRICAASPAIAAAVEYIQANFDRHIRLTDIADTADLSVGRFTHLFREQAGISPGRYLICVRIAHAKRLLTTTQDSCGTVGYMVGFSHQGHFTRTFKRLTGTTPQRFRLSQR